jgi:hypothetical protein
MVVPYHTIPYHHTVSASFVSIVAFQNIHHFAKRGTMCKVGQLARINLETEKIFVTAVDDDSFCCCEYNLLEDEEESQDQNGHSKSKFPLKWKEDDFCFYRDGVQKILSDVDETYQEKYLGELFVRFIQKRLESLRKKQKSKGDDDTGKKETLKAILAVTRSGNQKKATKTTPGRHQQDTVTQRDPGDHDFYKVGVQKVLLDVMFNLIECSLK